MDGCSSIQCQIISRRVIGGERPISKGPKNEMRLLLYILSPKLTLQYMGEFSNFSSKALCPQWKKTNYLIHILNSHSVHYVAHNGRRAER